MEELKNEIIMKLQTSGEFSTELLMMIDQALSEALRNYEVHRLCTEIAVQTVKRCPELDAFLLRKEFRGLSDDTIRQYKYLLNAYVAWSDKDIKLATSDDLRAFLTAYAKINNISDRTKDSKRLILRSFYTFLHQNGYISENPSIAVEPIKYKQKVREPLTPMEIELMRKACTSEFEEALFETFYSTGCRVAEVMNMKISDIDFENDQIKVCGKGDKERIVLLTPRAHLAIKVYVGNRGFQSDNLFASDSKHHKSLGKCSLEKRIRELGEKAGIGKTVTPHRIRHTFATVALAKGIPVEYVQKLLGHTKTETTLIYAHISLNKTKSLFDGVMS